MSLFTSQNVLTFIPHLSLLPSQDLLSLLTSHNVLTFIPHLSLLPSQDVLTFIPSKISSFYPKMSLLSFQDLLTLNPRWYLRQQLNRGLCRPPQVCESLRPPCLLQGILSRPDGPFGLQNAPCSFLIGKMFPASFAQRPDTPV